MPSAAAAQAPSRLEAPTDAGAAAIVAADAQVVEGASAGDAAVSERARVVSVIDGDTFVVASGERVRILNIDTAEKPPLAKCPEEERLAQAAKVRLSALVAGDEVVLVAEGRDRDRHGRLLRRVLLNGEDIGQRMISEGLAHAWVGRKLPWCG